MKEGVEPNGACWLRLSKLMALFENVAIKRLYVQKDSKINLTLLFNGSYEDCERLRIFLKSQFPTEDNCTVFIRNEELAADYMWKIELIDILIES